VFSTRSYFLSGLGGANILLFISKRRKVKSSNGVGKKWVSRKEHYGKTKISLRDKSLEILQVMSQDSGAFSLFDL
jgi:hypothetical protein